jgi:protein-S-isoprenylcysteine O-methyltransferase Ste14
VILPLFLLGGISGALLLLTLIVSIPFPTYRIWPHGDLDWTFWFSWSLWILYTAGLFGVAYLDWQSVYEPSAVVAVSASVLMLVGGFICLWSVWRLGFRESSGLKGGVETGGPYGYARNPQYVGILLMLVGGSILAGSWMTAAIAFEGVVWFLIAPLAEEPWLRKQYGKEYEDYCKDVPRFIGLGIPHVRNAD